MLGTRDGLSGVKLDVSDQQGQPGELASSGALQSAGPGNVSAPLTTLAWRALRESAPLVRLRRDVEGTLSGSRSGAVRATWSLEESTPVDCPPRLRCRKKLGGSEEPVCRVGAPLARSFAAGGFGPATFVHPAVQQPLTVATCDAKISGLDHWALHARLRSLCAFATRHDSHTDKPLPWLVLVTLEYSPRR